MDEADLAQAAEEQNLALALAKRRTGNSLLPMGACHYCGEATHGHKLFCGLGCSQDYEVERTHRLRNGGG